MLRSSVALLMEGPPGKKEMKTVAIGPVLTGVISVSGTKKGVVVMVTGLPSCHLSSLEPPAWSSIQCFSPVEMML